MELAIIIAILNEKAMQGYDAALKLLLQNSSSFVLQQIIAGTTVTRWLNTELPRIQARRADLLGITTNDQLIHIELQSSNDEDMPLRMAEYALGIYRQFRKLPKQIALYVGEQQMHMDRRLAGPDFDNPDFAFRYALFDFRDLDGEVLLKSPLIEDNVLAILTRLQNQAAAARQILTRIAKLEEAARRAIFAQFLIISGLRRLEQKIEEEARKMPILNDILSHQVIGPAILQGREQGLQEGRQEGRQEVLLVLIKKRFGSVPTWVEDRVASLSASEADDLAVRLLDVASLEALFPDHD